MSLLTELGFARGFALRAEPLASWEEAARAKPAKQWEKLVADPRRILPEARSLLLLARAYAPYIEKGNQPTVDAYYPASQAAFAAAAAFASALQAAGYAAKAHPALPLKPLAERAGLGRYGRNGLIAAPLYGSRLALQAIVSDAPPEALADFGLEVVAPDLLAQGQEPASPETPAHCGPKATAPDPLAQGQEPAPPEALADFGLEAVAPDLLTQGQEPALPETPAHCGPETAFSALCAHCDRCVRACPTGALAGDGRVDIGKCLRAQAEDAPLKEEYRPLIGARLLGCDLCQSCCPRNAAVGRATMPDGLRRALDLDRLLRGETKELADWIGGNNARKYRTIAKACLIAANRARVDCLDALRPLADDPAYLPVREHARWALRRLANRPDDDKS